MQGKALLSMPSTLAPWDLPLVRGQKAPTEVPSPKPTGFHVAFSASL